MPETALVISATSPVPADTGKRVVLNGLLRYMVDRLGSNNVHYGLVGQAGDPPPFPVVFHHLDRPSGGAQVAALARCVTRRSYTLQEAMLGSSALARQIRALVTELRPGIEVYDTLRLGQHAPAEFRSARRVLYVDDLFSVRYGRMLAVAKQGEVDIDPLSTFADNVPSWLRSLARQPMFYMPLLRFERDRIRRREAEVVRNFDVSLLVNADEVGVLRQRSGVPTVEACTPLLPAISGVSRRPVDPPDFVFLGNLNQPHNDDAIRSFIRIAMSGLEQRCPGARLRIVGKNDGEALRALAAHHPSSVVLEGFVEDLDDVLAQATAVIAPLRFGSGVKIKVLEALARGVPVLATTTAAEGIPIAAHGADGCLVEDDLARWPELLAGLAQSDRRERLSTRALDFFARTYSNAVVTARYDALFGLSAALQGQ